MKGTARTTVGKVIFRVDAGEAIGFGHAIRSISLARHLRDSFEISCIFVSRHHEKLEKLYRESRFAYRFSNAANEEEFLNEIEACYTGQVLFIDKLYPYSRETIRNISRRLRVVMFHNECDGMFESEYAIFPSAHLSSALIQDRRWEESRTRFLHGPEYILINDKIAQFLSRPFATAGSKTDSMAITTGANDPKGILIQLLSWLNQSSLTLRVNALVGFDFCGWRELKALMPSLKSSMSIKQFNLSDLFAAKLAVAAFGVTAYELIYGGIPLITIGHLPKNALGSEILQERYGCNYNLGLYEDLTENEFISTVTRLWYDPPTLLAMKQKQNGLIDGRGMARLGHILCDLCLK